ncbi:laccase [Janibacter sp. Soil728]|uniref:polyphenol oxidase family protein n=1 Tax=Janibacter sp. Soil728 TaxID=1736393 RepID=UPI0006FF1737|nr:polyphenol oxidase family protein [Janibacter sp. Soil728]KRE38335.1 laccase [Janibacter sp. Soil728]
MFAWRDDDAGLVRAFTDRHDGVSAAPFAGLNLGAHVGDDPAAVAANRARLEEAIGMTSVWADQVHGSDVLHVTQELLRGPRTDTGAVGIGDAMVTDLPGIALGVLVADCTPVLVHDEDSALVGVAHAGRPGMVAGVAQRLVEAMRDLGATHLIASVGPSVCGRCYEVPVEMRAAAAQVAPVSAAVTWAGTAAIDVASGVVDQLQGSGVPVRWVPGCAREDDAYFSYRRDGQTGRFAGVIGRPA